jgi:hypothetical protein
VSFSTRTANDNGSPRAKLLFVGVIDSVKGDGDVAADAGPEERLTTTAIARTTAVSARGRTTRRAPRRDVVARYGRDRSARTRPVIAAPASEERVCSPIIALATRALNR